MSNPNKWLLATSIAALAGLMLLLPQSKAGTVVGERAPAAERNSAAKLYQVRCWQYGRLLFEEQDVRLDDEVMAGLKLRGTDRQHHPLMVTDTGNATCLIRSNPPSRR